MHPIKPLHINTSDRLGGAGRSAYRIHKTMQSKGLGSRMMVGRKTTSDPDISEIANRIRWKLLDKAAGAVCNRFDWQYLYYPSTYALLKHPWFQEADIIQLYNIHGGYFAFPALAKISRQKPIVWRLSDQWLMTGHCGYSYDCERWLSGCGQCPYLNEYPALKRDRTAMLWKKKEHIYRQCDFHLVAPSSWTYALAQKSPLLSRFPLHLVHNGIDLDTFRPRDKGYSRDLFNLPQDKFIILCPAASSDARRKGCHITQDILRQLWQAGYQNFAAAYIGNDPGNTDEAFPTYYLDSINDDKLMSAAYAAADVFFLAPLADNLPNTVLESIACGTPVVTWNVGGMKDAIRTGETGWLCETMNPDDLFNTMKEALQLTEQLPELQRSARQVAEHEFTPEREAGQLINIYGNLINN